jgi:Flagellar motor switch protein
MNDIELNQDAVDLNIDNIEKAAILMLSMGEEAASRIFKRLNRDEVQLLGQAMARLHNVSTTEAKWILQQFFTQYKNRAASVVPRGCIWNARSIWRWVINSRAIFWITCMAIPFATNCSCCSGSPPKRWRDSSAMSTFNCRP